MSVSVRPTWSTGTSVRPHLTDSGWPTSPTSAPGMAVVYTAFVTDVFSRYIVGWKVSTALRAEVALDALEMAIWSRGTTDLKGLVHHSDRGVQYLAIRYTERLADAGAVCSVGSRGDSYDNALAESVIGLYKTEVIRKQRPWRSFEQLELATASWVEWYNNRRLHTSIRDLPPAEFESTYYREHAASAVARKPNGEVSKKPRAVHRESARV